MKLVRLDGRFFTIPESPESAFCWILEYVEGADGDDLLDIFLEDVMDYSKGAL